MTKTPVKASLRKDGVKVRAHERVKPSAATTADTGAAADAAAGAAETAGHAGRVIDADASLFPEAEESLAALRERTGPAAIDDLEAELEHPDSTPPSDAFDGAGHWINKKASPQTRTLAAALTPGRIVTSEFVDAVCVAAGERLVRLETEHYIRDDWSPSPDLQTVRQTLVGVAAHPAASREAVLTAVKCEMKYAAREAVRRDDPELVEAAFECSGVGEWHAVDGAGIPNRALKEHRLAVLVTHANRRPPRSDPDDIAWQRRHVDALRRHPNMTDELREKLPSAEPAEPAGSTGSDSAAF